MNGYLTEYQKKLTTPQNAVADMQNGSVIVPGMITAEPPAIMAAIADRARQGDLKDLSVYCISPGPHAANTLLMPDLSDCIQVYTWFVGKMDRAGVKVGLDYFVPNYFHQVPRFITDFMQVDAAIMCVSPMDKAGFFSFGAANDFTSTAARHCKKLIVEVNEYMPRVFGDSSLHISEVDCVVENSLPLREMPPHESAPEDEIIAKTIAGMVPDGATLQLGVGRIPETVTRHLRDHKDLGIHTEQFCPGMVDLIEAGVVTGKMKTLHPMKNVFTYAFGNKYMFDYLNNNPSMESYPVSYVNNPDVIAMNDNMVSINTILEVDLLGQCNSEYMAGSQFSGTGGQLDYVRGAYDSRNGKSILGFNSTAKHGQVSRIVPCLKAGTVVTTPRMDTHYLVTEYGAVNLKGKSTRERALDIISIAHPRFRDELLREAENMYLL